MTSSSFSEQHAVREFRWRSSVLVRAQQFQKCFVHQIIAIFRDCEWNMLMTTKITESGYMRQSIKKKSNCKYSLGISKVHFHE